MFRREATRLACAGAAVAVCQFRPSRVIPSRAQRSGGGGEGTEAEWRKDESKGGGGCSIAPDKTWTSSLSFPRSSLASLKFSPPLGPAQTSMSLYSPRYKKRNSLASARAATRPQLPSARVLWSEPRRSYNRGDALRSLVPPFSYNHVPIAISPSPLFCSPPKPHPAHRTSRSLIRPIQRYYCCYILQLYLIVGRIQQYSSSDTTTVISYSYTL